MDWITSHLKSASSWAAVLLTVLGTVMASGLVTDSVAAHIIGAAINVLSILGFKPTQVPAQSGN